MTIHEDVSEKAILSIVLGIAFYDFTGDVFVYFCEKINITVDGITLDFISNLYYNI